MVSDHHTNDNNNNNNNNNNIIINNNNNNTLYISLPITHNYHCFMPKYNFEELEQKQLWLFLNEF